MSAATENETIDPEIEQDDADDVTATLSDAGKAAIKAERDARKQAAKEARELRIELDALKADKADADAEKAAADEAEAIKRGEFEKLAGERAETIKTLTGERDGYKTQLDTLIAAIKPDVDAAWQDVPDELKSFYSGADDDVLAKRAFLAKSKPALDKLAAQQEAQNQAFRGYPKTPKPNGTGKQELTPLVPAKL